MPAPEFMRLVRRLWMEENVSYDGEHFGVTGSTVAHADEGAWRSSPPEAVSAAPRGCRKRRGYRASSSSGVNHSMASASASRA